MTAVEKRPTVLIVDDEEASARAAAVVLGNSVQSICRLPNDVRDRDLSAANLVLVDFRIDDWEERDQLETPSLRPKDGLALIATLRSNLSKASSRSPTAFALRSGLLADVSGGLNHSGREHALARMYDLEWVFDKGSAREVFSRQVTALADAVKRLPHPWPPLKRRRAALSRFLALSAKQPWARSAHEDIDRAFPPEDAESEVTRGLAVIRWLLHQLLPYPGPLLDSRYLAARLHLRPDNFAAAISGRRTSAINRALAPFEYNGALASFLGRRWWRAGVEHWLWNSTKGRPLEKEAIVAALRKLVRDENAYSPLSQPVVSVDDQFRPTDSLIELRDAVQLRPDDWPQAADPAWALASEVRNDDAAMARIDPRDRDRVQSMRADTGQA